MVMLTMAIFVIAQSPQAFKYQTVIRDNGGEVLSNQNVSFQISILEGSITGTAAYIETHDTITNEVGLVSLEIGNGDIVSGMFTDIDWGVDSYFLKVDLDETGGTSYQLMGASQLLSVPYSLYSESTGDTTRWRKNNDKLYYNDGNVGIGISNPFTKLTVDGTGYFNGDAFFVDYDTNEVFIDLYNITSDWLIVAAADTNRLDFRVWDGDTVLSTMANGNVGIGTIVPDAKLDIRGSFPGDDAAINIGNFDLSHKLTLFGGSENDPNPFIQWNYWDTLRFKNDINGWPDLMRITPDGHLGIGTDVPLSGLHVAANTGVLFTGDLNIGLIPTEGGSTRTMWYPGKSAFRAGTVTSYQWDDFKIGKYSMALGYNTEASGYKSTALGDSTTASGDYSTAFGRHSIASGGNSIAMGLEAEAIGVRTVSIGYGTNAIGDDAYAMGAGTTAFGNFSIAIGGNASGTSSMALGGGSASGSSSIAIGMSAEAVENNSLALGENTIASAMYSIAIGNNSEASSEGSVVIGFSSEAKGIGSTAMGNGTVSSGHFSTAIGYDTETSGEYSTAMGFSTIGASYSSIALGRYNVGFGDPDNWVETDPLFEIGNGSSFTQRANALTVLKNGSVGIGTITPTEMLEVADTIYSSMGGFKFPDGTVQVTATSSAGNTLDEAYDQGGAGTGRTIIADAGAFEVDGVDGVLLTGTFGSGSIPAQGTGTRLMWYPGKAALRAGSVSGNYWDNDSIGNYSLASGYSPKASGDNSTAMGHWTTASGSYSFAVGDGSKASGNYSTAMGSITVASGQRSIAMGHQTTASGDFSTTMGNYTHASGENSIAMGVGTIASGNNSTAMGNSTSATGDDATAMGVSTTAGGYLSTSFGFGSEASGTNSTAFGDGTDAESYTSFVLGRCNVGGGNPTSWVDTDPLFEIGNGFSFDQRANALTVLKSGNIGIGTSIPLGPLHIEDVDIGLQLSDISNEIVTLEDSDAGLGLYSNSGGFNGSFFSLGEIALGTFTNKWSIYRTTSTAGQPNQLRFSFGNNADYYSNPSYFKISENGDFELNGSLELQSGVSINEFSNDTTLAGSSDTSVPTEKAVKSYVDNIGTVPVGSIIAWAKDLSGVPDLPDNYAECNGQVVNDPESPLIGVTLPSMNAGMFLKGYPSSGNVGGSISHTHNVTGPTNSSLYSVSVTQGDPPHVNVEQPGHSHDVNINTSEYFHEPPYYTVVWVMRIK